MRGALKGMFGPVMTLRIIPADAGSTIPRTHLSYAQMGSSPRMRGALFQCVSGCLARGIIPADAGSTQGCTSHPYAYEDHPRGCGEHPEKGDYSSDSSGSSPRMRGAQIDNLSCILRIRIIPADAGSTHLIVVVFLGLKDHPRGCGEHS